MSGLARSAGEPSPLYARWCRIDTGPGTDDETITERWCSLYDEERVFWREIDAIARTGHGAHEPMAPAAKPADPSPRAITLEIVERGGKTTDTLAGSVIIPTEIRINGVSVLASADEPVRVKRMDFPNREAAMVTLTLFVRKLVVASEGDL